MKEKNQLELKTILDNFDNAIAGSPKLSISEVTRIQKFINSIHSILDISYYKSEDKKKYYDKKLEEALRRN